MILAFVAALFLEGLDAFKRDLVFFFFVEDETVFFAAIGFFLFDAFFVLTTFLVFVLTVFFVTVFLVFFGLLFDPSTVRLPAAFLFAVGVPVTAFFLDFVFTLTLELLVDFFDFTVFFAVFFVLVAIVTP